MPGNQFDENTKAYNVTNIGDGRRDSRHHSDADEMSGYSKNFLSQCNVINSDDPDYAGNADTAAQRTTVDVGRANRGKES